LIKLNIDIFEFRGEIDKVKIILKKYNGNFMLILWSVEEDFLKGFKSWLHSKNP